VTKLEDETAQLRAVNVQQLEDYQRLQEEFRELLENHKKLQGVRSGRLCTALGNCKCLCLSVEKQNE
jgi:hypothetical protein